MEALSEKTYFETSNIVSFQKYKQSKNTDEKEEKQLTTKDNQNIHMIIPFQFEDLKDIVSYLRRGDTVVCRINMALKEAQRYIDFIYGICYALECKLKTSNNTFTIKL